MYGSDLQGINMTTINNNNNDIKTETTTDLEKDLNMESVQQLTTQDDRIVKVDSGYISGAPSSLPSNESDMNTQKMTAEDIMRNPLITRDVIWTTTQVRNDIITSFKIPQIFDEIPLTHKNILQQYAFTNYTLRMDFRLNTTPFHCGRLVVWFDPMDYTNFPAIDNVTIRQQNVYRASMQPSVEMDAGTNNVATLDIPWEHFVSYINLDSDYSNTYQNGTIYVMVQNPLQVPDTVRNDVDLNIMVSCKDINLMMMTRPHELQVVEPVQVNMNVASTLLGAVSDLATGNLGGLAKTGMDAAGKFLNLDKPVPLDVKTTNCLATVAPLAHVRGVDGSLRLASDPDSSYTENHFSLAPREEKDIYRVVQTRALFDIKPWSMDDVTSTEIVSWKVRPGLYGSNREQLPQLGDQPPTYRETPSFLSYVEKGFRMWAGSIVFKLKFAATQYHSGKLQISFQPTTTPKPLVTTDTVQDYQQTNVIIFDLHETKTITFHVPYVSAYASLRTSNTGDPSIDTFTDVDCLGILRVKVLNRLTGSAGIANTIEMNCYISAGPDFEFDAFGIASDQALLAEDVILATPEEVEPNMADDSTQVRSEDYDTGVSIVKGSRSRTQRNRFKEDISDVRDLCKRYGLWAEDAVNLTSYNYILGPNPSNMYVGSISYPVGYTVNIANRRGILSYMPLHYFSRLYVMKSGSIRFKWIPMVNRTQSILWRPVYGILDNDKADVYPIVSSYSVNESYPQNIQNSSQDAGLDYECPFYSIFNQLLNSRDAGLAGAQLSSDTPYVSGTVSLIAKTTSVEGLPTVADVPYIPVMTYAAAGNDFDMRFLISPPDIYQQKTS